MSVPRFSSPGDRYISDAHVELKDTILLLSIDFEDHKVYLGLGENHL